MEAAIGTLQRTLKESDPTRLQPLLGNEVLLDDTLVERNVAWQWLAARWGPIGTSRLVIGTDYIEHFILLEVQTTGWAKIAPLQIGNITFHLHRYNTEGRGDPLAGDWRIDAIFYQ
jgi:hypothetical protein